MKFFKVQEFSKLQQATEQSRSTNKTFTVTFNSSDFKKLGQTIFPGVACLPITIQNFQLNLFTLDS